MQRHQHLASVLAIVAMALRALLPAGFMPAVDASGAPVLVLCTAQGAQARAVDTLKKPATHVSHGQQCPFGFALSMAAATASAPATAFAHHSVAQESVATRDAPGATRKPYAARGPPFAMV